MNARSANVRDLTEDQPRTGSLDDAQGHSALWDQRQRTLLSRERTFNSWVRTGISAEVAGLAIARWMASSEVTWLATALGALFVLIGGMVFIRAFVNYRRALSHSDVAQRQQRPSKGTLILTIGLVISAILALALIGSWLAFGA